MGKISPVSAKYIVHTAIQIEGVVDKPDIIGAIFGQTEGLLGADLELRELQRSGRIGRIEVNTDIKSGKSEGMITIPSSLDKAETAIIAAAMETIQRIGPCNAKVKVEKIEDVRISKRNYVLQRAKDLLRSLTEEILPDSQELTDEVEQSVRMMGVVEYGKDRLPAGPAIDESEEVIVVEGRADVLNLLKHGFKNAVAMNGTSVPQTIIDLCSAKVVTLFVDGDRGGDLIIKELTGVAEVDFVVKAPDGKEVEEITKKEIHKALRGRISAEQAKLDLKDVVPTKNAVIGNGRPQYRTYGREQQPYNREGSFSRPAAPVRRVNITPEQKTKFKELLDDLVGTRGAYILDEGMNILGKVPATELPTTIRSLKGINTIIFDGSITKELVMMAERTSIERIIAMDSKVKPGESRIDVLTSGFFSSS